MRIALFGGSFDPPHRGHTDIASAAAEAFRLSVVLFAPAGLQPLKPAGHSASFEQRFKMTQLACADADPGRFFASRIDSPRPDGLPNYTVDSLEALRRAHPHAELFAIAGADSFQHLAQWRSPGRLIELAEWIVVSRPGVPLAIPEDLALSPAQRARIDLLDAVHTDVAATSLRERLVTGDLCSDLLSPAVATYIDRQSLYGRQSKA